MDINEFIYKYVVPKSRKMELWMEPDGEGALHIHIRLRARGGAVSHVNLCGVLDEAVRALS